MVVSSNIFKGFRENSCLWINKWRAVRKDLGVHPIHLSAPLHASASLLTSYAPSTAGIGHGKAQLPVVNKACQIPPESTAGSTWLPAASHLAEKARIHAQDRCQNNPVKDLNWQSPSSGRSNFLSWLLPQVSNRVAILLEQADRYLGLSQDLLLCASNHLQRFGDFSVLNSLSGFVLLPQGNRFIAVVRWTHGDSKKYSASFWLIPILTSDTEKPSKIHTTGPPTSSNLLQSMLKGRCVRFHSSLTASSWSQGKI